jgi:hypothetical protein
MRNDKSIELERAYSEADKLETQLGIYIYIYIYTYILGCMYMCIGKYEYMYMSVCI